MRSVLIAAYHGRHHGRQPLALRALVSQFPVIIATTSRAFAVGYAYITFRTVRKNASVGDVVSCISNSTITMTAGDTELLYVNGVRDAARRNAHTFRTVENNVAVGNVVVNISKDLGYGCGGVASASHEPDESDHTGVGNIRARKLF